LAHKRRNDVLIPTLNVLADSIAIELSFLLSYWMRFKTGTLTFLPLAEEVPSLDAYVYGSLVVIPVWLLLFKARGMYRARRNTPLSDEFFAVVKVVTWGMLIVMSAAFFYRAFSYSRVVFGLLWVTSAATIFTGRMLVHSFEKSLHTRGRELRNAVLIGGGDVAARVFNALHNHPLLGYRFIGFFAGSTQGGTPSPLSEIPQLGTYADVPAQLADRDVELALIAVGYLEYPGLRGLIQDCEGINVEFMMVPDFILGLMANPENAGLTEIGGIPFIRLKGIPMTTWGRITKRGFDALVSLLLLAVFSPLFLIIAAAIKLSSRGPVFFRQERVGMDGTPFEIFKFRSMKVGAEEDTGPVWAKEHDPRRTPVGTFLRRTSLDELPQLFNVLKGEMSLVGPRPERPYFVEQFRQLVPKYLDRHRVKTGMTGWAQVNGLRGNTSLEERIKYDIYYIENWSVGFDIKILLRTVHALLRITHAH
jgi:exopolysaccharide biosynthesis polyprenyl glycosylphosphotransferase